MSECERVGEIRVEGLAYYLAGDRSVECTLTRDWRERPRMEFVAKSRKGH